MTGPDELMLASEVAEWLRVSESTLGYWRMNKTGPASFKLGKRVLYRRSAVDAWLADREQAAS